MCFYSFLKCKLDSSYLKCFENNQIPYQFSKYQQFTNKKSNQVKIMKQKSNGGSYKCSQVFGYKGANEKVHQEDIITKLKFSQDGKYLALGDKAGRVIIFQSANGKKSEDKMNYLTEFQAYSREFDPLNSSDIDQQVVSLTWMRTQGNYQKMITTNSKFVKLWKIFERPTRKLIKSANKDLSLPKFQVTQKSTDAVLQHTFPNHHEQDIIEAQQTYNQQYMICTDSVKTLLWSFEKNQKPYLITDLQKGKPLEQVKQQINCLKLHPTSDSMFAYGTNKGSIVMSDTRISSSYKPLVYKIESKQQKSNFFTQMISSYSSIDFMNSKYIVARDYLTVKVWDIKKFDKPILSLTVQESIKSKLCQIFQNDCIFDKFNISVSKDCNSLLTGNYNNTFHMVDINSSANTQYEINYKKQTITRPMQAGCTTKLDRMDYARKVIAGDFSPVGNMFAVASLNCFLIYSI